jgi:hypothetical protein
MHDSYYPVERQMSTVAFPGVIPHAGSIIPRQRRHSTVSIGHLPPPMDAYRRPSSINIKFKRKGSFVAGISLPEAQSHVRLSNNDSYTIHDFHADTRGRILLKIRVGSLNIGLVIIWPNEYFLSIVVWVLVANVRDSRGEL